MMKLMDDVEWRRVERDLGGFGPNSDFGWDFGEDLGSEVGGLEIEGPLELRAVGEGDELELRLPAIDVLPCLLAPANGYLSTLQQDIDHHSHSRDIWPLPTSYPNCGCGHIS